MPSIPKSGSPRPWITPRKPFEGRVQSKFYYTAIWRRVRLAHIMEYPLCETCKKKGETTPATDVDHIIPINPENPWDYKDKPYWNPIDSVNLQSLCKSCHAKKTGAEKGAEYR
jgi:5-methylcytosine-specific restriction enzyme A